MTSRRLRDGYVKRGNIDGVLGRERWASGGVFRPRPGEAIPLPRVLDPPHGETVGALQEVSYRGVAGPPDLAGRDCPTKVWVMMLTKLSY